MNTSLGRSAAFFATRSAIEFSYDGGTWFKEGDRVNILSDMLSLKDAEIICIYDTGNLLVKHDEVETTFQIKDISISISDSSGTYHRGDIIAFREVSQFSTDLKNWFSIGQTCIICSEYEIFINCVILEIYDNGRILIDYNGQSIKLKYNQITDIWDSYENLMYPYSSAI